MQNARWEPPDEATTAVAVAALRELVAGREDGPALLAETAGILVGCHEGDLKEARLGTGLSSASRPGPTRN